MSEEGLGACFDNSFGVLVEFHMTGIESARLVHGIVTGDGSDIKGFKFLHSWVEIGTDEVVVVDAAKPERVIVQARDVYYHRGCIEKVKRYTFEEALRLTVAFEHLGPWDDDLVLFGEAEDFIPQTLQLLQQNAVGSRVRLVAMPNDPDPVAVGDEGVVRSIVPVGDWHQVDVAWDSGRSLMLTCPPDLVEVLDAVLD